MASQQLILDIEKEFDEFDRLEVAQLEEILEKHKHVKEEFLDSTEKEEISHFLQETREKFNELIVVISPEGTVTPANRVKAIGLSRDIYIDLMLSLHLTRDLDLRNPEVRRKLLGGLSLEKATPPDSLYKKIKAHFIEGELYFVLDVRTSTELKDRSAFAGFNKVIDEGMILYDHFVADPKKNVKKFLDTIKLVRDIATAYARLSSLYFREGKDEKAQTAKAQAHGWYGIMFGLNNSNHVPCDVSQVFSSKEMFLRYLTDIHSMESFCVFQYEQNGAMVCIKTDGSPQNLCKYRIGNRCSYTPIEQEDIVTRAHEAREDFS